ncbi:MAG: hypothetical protein Kow0069_16270 [Promethearchaeota archaeon]
MKVEDRVLAFLRKSGNRASLKEIAKFLGLREYGKDSAYQVLKGLVARGALEKLGTIFKLRPDSGPGSEFAPDDEDEGGDEELDMEEIDEMLARAQSSDGGDLQGASSSPGASVGAASGARTARSGLRGAGAGTRPPGRARTGSSRTGRSPPAPSPEPVETTSVVSTRGRTVAEKLGKALLSLLKGGVPDLEHVLSGEDEADLLVEREPLTEEEEELLALTLRPSAEYVASKEVVPLETGTLLDRMFLDANGEPLGGVPLGGQFGISGVPGSGKSLLVHELLVNLAGAGRKVAFVTTEEQWETDSGRPDLQSRLYEKAEFLGVPWSDVVENVVVLDLIAQKELREWNKLYAAYTYLLEVHGVEVLVFDSVTILDTSRYRLKFRVMELARINQQHGVTGFFVNQRSKNTWDSYDVAGGIGVPHALDANVSLDHGRVNRIDQLVDLGVIRGMPVRILRVLDCRLGPFDPTPVWVTIVEHGFVREISDEEREELLENYREKILEAREKLSRVGRSTSKVDARLDDYERMERERGRTVDLEDVDALLRDLEGTDVGAPEGEEQKRDKDVGEGGVDHKAASGGEVEEAQKRTAGKRKAPPKFRREV